MGYGPHGDLTLEQYQKYLKLGGRPDKPVPKPKPVGFGFRSPRGVPLTGTGADPIRNQIDPAQIAKRARERTEALRRQRLLKLNGFNIVVDGLWGPRSQAAWNSYQRGAGRTMMDDGKGSHPNLALSFPQAKDRSADEERRAREQSRLDAAIKKQADQLAKENARKKKIADQRAAIIQRAGVLRRNPAAASRMSLADLTSVVIDPVANFNPAKNRQAALAVQYNLRAKGFKVQLTGTFDKPTYEALKTAYKRAERRERNKRLDAIRTKLYEPLNLRGGETPAGFPLDRVPSPGELDKMIQDGGFTAKLIGGWFERQIATDYDAFATARLRQLERVARDFQPFLLPAKFGKANIISILGALYGVEDLAHRDDLSDKTPEQIQSALAKRSKDRNTQLENAAAIMELRDQVSALMKAKDVEDFTTKLARYEAVSEEKFKRLQAQMAQDIPWWGKAIERIMAPGEFLRTAAVYDVMRGTQLILGGPEERAVRWEDAAVTLGADPDEMPDYDGLAEAANGISRFGFSVFADPINLAAPFKWSSMAAKTLSGSERLGGYAIKGAGWDKALVYNKGTWSKAALVGRVPGAQGVAQTRAFQRMHALGVQLSTLKEERMQAVSKRITMMGRHAFRNPEHPIAKKLWKQTGNPANAQKVIDTRNAVVGMLDDPEYEDLFGELMRVVGEDELLSVYVSADREHLSNVGASLLGSMAEKARVAAAHQDATDVALDLIEETNYTELVTEYRNLSKREVKDGAPRQAKAERLAVLREQIDLARDKIVRGYNDSVESVGAFLVGGTADVSVGRGIYKRTTAKMDTIEDVLFPAMQDAIERRAGERLAAAKLAAREADGIRPPVEDPLWDEKGIWIGRNGEGATRLRERARASFDEENLIEVDNAAYNKGHTAIEAQDAIDFETRRAVPRILNFAAREAKAQGDNFTFDVGAAVNREKERIASSWEMRTDGLYYDTRPKVKVNRLYARNFRDAAVSRKELLEELLDPDTGTILSDGIDRLALPPAIGYEDALDETLAKIMWQFGSRYRKFRGPGSGRLEDALSIAGTRRLRIPEAPDGLTGEQRATWYEEEFARLDNVSGTFAAHKIALADAADSMLSGELVKEKLYMQALSRAQSKHAKAAYLALHGSMRVWIFATLPLRPGWVVRNTIDNFSKAIIQGVRDPRLLFLGAEKPGAAIKSIFDIGVAPLRGVIKLFDGLFGTKALDAFDVLLAKFWEMPAEVISKVMGAHALPTPPPAALDGARFSHQVTSWRKGASGNPFRPTKRDYENAGEFGHKGLAKLNEKEALEAKKAAAESGSWVDRLHFKMRYEKQDTLWELMADRPESYFKRIIYRDTYRKAYKEGLDEARAAARARLATTKRVSVKMDVDEDLLWAHIHTTLNVPDGHTLHVRVVRPGKDGLDLNRALAGKTNAPAGSDLNRMRGLFDPISETEGAITIFVPEKMGFTSREGFAEFQKKMAETVEHEMRHSVQWQSWVTRKLRPTDAKLPYRFQLHEIEARFFGKRRGERVPDFITGDQEALDKLPASLVNHVEISAKAHAEAWDAVTDTLFDYSQITVAEDSLRLFFPFIQFWRKNTALWVGNFATKPWLDNAVLQFDRERQQSHRDLPQWMQRYISTDEIVDAAASVPGLGEVVEAMLPDNMQIDPLSFLSFAPLHRAWRDLFYGENQNLPPEEKGMRIIGPMVQAMNDWGLGLNPIIRKPLEAADVVDSRSWQMVFPQTSLAVAFAMPFLGQERAFKIADWERIFTFLLGKAPSEALAKNFNFYVNQEIANQVAKGEEPNREVAEATIRSLFYTQQLWGYFGGTYWRRATPEDIYISKLQDDVRNFEIQYDTLSDQDKKLLKLWSMRKQSPEDYDRYLAYAPLIEAYYRNPSWEEKEEMVADHPALTEWIDTTPQRKGLGQTWIRDAQRYTDTARFFTALELMKSIDAPSDVKSSAYDIFATPELRHWWKRNDTKAQIKDRMVQGEMYRYMTQLQKAYFKIPEKDYDARDGFLREHPELVQHWNRHNHQSDNYDAVMDSSKAALRDLYFTAMDKQGFGAAAKILKQFPFMFEGTKSEGKVKDGVWIGGKMANWSPERRNLWIKVASFAKWFFDVYMKKVGEDAAWEWLRKSDDPMAKAFVLYLSKYGKHRNGNWSAERIALYGKAKPYLKWFFDVFMKRVGEDKAWEWLNKSEDEGAKLIKEYFEKYGKSSQRATDYMKAKPYLSIYEKMPPAERAAWLKGNSEGAKIVRWFFDKYASGKDMSAHAKAYLAVKDDLDYYGSLPKEKRQEWLNSDDPRAMRVKQFFKNFGKQHQYERAFKKLIKAYPGLADGTPEQAARIRFWKKYYDLKPDERPAFIHDHAEDAGVFIYGDFSESYRHDREAEHLRRSIGLGISERAAAYLYVKPLMDFYRTLDKEEKPLFLRANPELQQYFDKYVKRSLSGDKKLDGLIEQYFKLPGDSILRSEFLRKHPEVQDYFDKKASPAERAMRNLLEQYFEIDGADERDDFLFHHPEVQEYFDARKREREEEKASLQAFDNADPRLKPFFENASDLIRSAEQEREWLKRSALRRLQPDTIESRRERRPLTRT